VQPLMIEDVDESIDPAFDPILLKQYNIINGRKLVKIGDQEIELDPTYKLFFSTKISNPNYLPEVFIR
jgi:dynein heavy chain